VPRTARVCDRPWSLLRLWKPCSSRTTQSGFRRTPSGFNTVAGVARLHDIA
jgi:hypothetical protein